MVIMVILLEIINKDNLPRFQTNILKCFQSHPVYIIKYLSWKLWPFSVTIPDNLDNSPPNLSFLNQLTEYGLTNRTMLERGYI